MPFDSIHRINTTRRTKNLKRFLTHWTFSDCWWCAQIKSSKYKCCHSPKHNICLDLFTRKVHFWFCRHNLSQASGEKPHLSDVWDLSSFVPVWRQTNSVMSRFSSDRNKKTKHYVTRFRKWLAILVFQSEGEICLLEKDNMQTRLLKTVLYIFRDISLWKVRKYTLSV